MFQIFSIENLLSTFHMVCEPSSDSFSDEFEMKLRFRRNQKFLIMQFTILTLLIIYLLFFKHTPNFTDYWFICVFVMNITVFCLVCRSHPRLFRLFYGIVMTLAGPTALYLDKDGIFACWATVYLAPMFMLYYSGCRFTYTAQVGIQLVYMSLYYKEKMIEAINERTSLDFVQNLMSCTIFAIIFSGIITYNIGVSLADTFKQEVVFAENKRKELEVQKTFVLSFSHEIRNLINSLTGNIQLSLLENVLPKVKEYLEDAEVGASLLIQLINNILDSGNLDVGELDISPSAQIIHCTLSRAWRMCAYLLKAKGLKGQFRIMKSLPRNLKLDHERFLQILINLVVNAIKFTDKGSVDIELAWVPDTTYVTEKCFYPSPFDDEDEGIFEKDQAFSILNDEFIIIGLDKKKWCCDKFANSQGAASGLLKVSVTDTGCGIRPDNLPNVFQRFSSQIFGDKISNKLGTTIGLYVTKELCNRMGGDIKVFSKVYKGTSFIACIPAEQISSPHTLQRSNTVLSTQSEERTLKAMIVDDMNFNIIVLSNYLQRMKIDVGNTAIDGLDAYTKYVASVKAGNQFDIVTMDVEMPVMDGKEAARLIRKFEKENNLSPCFIVMISGNVTESEISQCLRYDGDMLANHFLKKPATYDDLSRLINEHFSMSLRSVNSSYL